MRLFIVTLLLFPALSFGAVYKCEVGGKLVYQQTPCAESGEQMTILRAPTATPKLQPAKPKEPEPANTEDPAPVPSAADALRATRCIQAKSALGSRSAMRAIGPKNREIRERLNKLDTFDRANVERYCD